MASESIHNPNCLQTRTCCSARGSLRKEKGWMVPHSLATHGPPAGILPLLAVAQQHKAITTEGYPCLEYAPNGLLVSSPGANLLVCYDKLRKWRLHGEPDRHSLLDIRKAYSQVHMAAELMRSQVVKRLGQVFATTRIGFA